jgi:signal transduction histidine kinase
LSIKIILLFHKYVQDDLACFPMYRNGIKIIITTLLLIIFSSGGLAQEKKVRTCVMFFSYSASMVAYQNMLEGFKDSFIQPLNQPVSIVVEYLDLGRTNSGSYGKSIVDMYNQKYKENGIDLIIAVGPGILPFLKQAGLKMLYKSPIILVDIFTSQADSVDNASQINELPIYLKYNYFGKSLNTICNLFPDRRNVYCVNGDGMLDKYYKSILKDSQRSSSGTHKFFDITGISIDSTLRKISQLPEGSIVVMVSFSEDINGLPFTTPEVANLIAKISKVPFFILGGDSFPKDGGAIGGLVINYVNVGREFGKAANQIMSGTDPKSTKVNTPCFYQYIYDWRELRRWNLIYSKAIPEQSTFLYKTQSLVSEFKWYISGIMVFIVFQTLVIIYLVKAHRTQKKVKMQILENQYMLDKIVREDRLSKMTVLTASLSHELNQPLTGILSCAQAGLRFLDSDKLDRAQAKEIFENIIEDDTRAGSIISGVRSLMKIEIRKKKNVMINSLVAESLDIMRNEIMRHGITLMTKPENSPIFVIADKIQLQQVLLNFLRNSVDAIDKRDTGDKIIEVTVKLDNDLVTVTVGDSGPGIDKSILEKLFKPFVTTGKTGFGIGLAISRSIIEDHDGEIWAKNIPDGGAEFSFRLMTVRNGPVN